MASTIVSWGLTLCLVGAAIYVYRPDLVKGLVSQAQEVSPVLAETTPKISDKKTKPKKGVVSKLTGSDVAASSNESQSGKKRKIVPAQAEDMNAAKTADRKQQQSPRNEDDGLNDKDFAKQLAQAQSGTKLQVPSQSQPSKKDRRASKLTSSSSPDPSGFSTEASSTTGRDADDDLTPAESPQAQPVDGPASRAGDVSDMLEAPAAKPTTLRLTGVTNDAKAKKPANKAFEPVVSKKKRNEMQRKEEQRLAREESDRVHDAKKQEQLRKARMAAGTSNQTKANNFTAKANAWQSGPSTTVKTAPTDGAQSLLDTFDPATSISGQEAHGSVHTTTVTTNNANELKTAIGEQSASALTASASREGPSRAKREDYASEISEEYQMKMLEEQQHADAWESVTNKKSKRKGRPDADSNSGASSPVRAPPVSVKPQVSSNKHNGIAKKSEATNRFDSIQMQPASGLQDAEWEA